MLHFGKLISELGHSDRFRLLSCLNNDKKLDFQELDLGSPVSTMRRPAPTTTTTSRSSSFDSFNSVFDQTGPNLVQKRFDSWELSASGETNSPNRTFKPSHRRSDSHLLIYSGQTQRSSPSPSFVVKSLPLNTLPSRNICPSDRIPKASMAMRCYYQPFLHKYLTSGEEEKAAKKWNADTNAS